jgi:hypothetical protein
VPCLVLHRIALAVVSEWCQFNLISEYHGRPPSDLLLHDSLLDPRELSPVGLQPYAENPYLLISAQASKPQILAAGCNRG